MSQEKEVEDISHSKNSFGTGFILGAVFASLAIFFLTTKTGKAMLKGLNSPEFDVDKFNRFLKDRVMDFHQESEKESFKAKNESNSTAPTEENAQIEPQPPTRIILGRRFFRKRH